MIDKKEVNFDKLVRRVYMNNPIISYNGARMIAEKMIRECPEEIIQNLKEWANEEPISDIYIGRLSVNKLMNVWGNLYSFPTAITALSLYKKTGCILEDDAIRYGAPWYNSDEEI